MLSARHTHAGGTEVSGAHITRFTLAQMVKQLLRLLDHLVNVGAREVFCDQRHLWLFVGPTTIAVRAAPQAAKEASMNKTAGTAAHRWFGLTPSQLLWAVAIRVIVAAIVGVVVFFATGSVLWLIVALDRPVP